MDCVLDASTFLRLCLPDEPEDASVRDIVWGGEGSTLHVPSLWAAELRNGLLRAERRKRITPDAVNFFLVKSAQLALRTYEIQGDLDMAVELSRRYQLSVYDALYIALAVRLDLPLATLDVQQSLAARAEGVALLLG